MKGVLFVNSHYIAAEPKPPHAPRGFAIPVGHERYTGGYKPAQIRGLRLFGQALSIEFKVFFP